jgi:hypothetical protein
MADVLRRGEAAKLDQLHPRLFSPPSMPGDRRWHRSGVHPGGATWSMLPPIPVAGSNLSAMRLPAVGLRAARHLVFRS